MAESSELRQFMREIASRHERIWREQADMLWRMLDELQDLRHENRAQAQALLRILDRLENGGAQA